MDGLRKSVSSKQYLQLDTTSSLVMGWIPANQRRLYQQVQGPIQVDGHQIFSLPKQTYTGNPTQIIQHRLPIEIIAPDRIRHLVERKTGTRPPDGRDDSLDTVYKYKCRMCIPRIQVL